MSSKKKISQVDLDAFYQAIKGTKPLPQKKIRLTKQAHSIKKNIAKDHENQFEFDETDDLPTLKSDEFISYKHDAISHKTLRKLRKGQYNVDAILDLHGLTIEKARAAVGHFLQTCLRENCRVVLIIHGKGLHRDKPILKNKLNHWLRHLNVVLAFCSATAAHGSRGAIYVLLKRISGENDF